MGIITLADIFEGIADLIEDCMLWMTEEEWEEFKKSLEDEEE